MSNFTTGFKAKHGEFERRARRRVLYEILVLILTASYFASSGSSRIPTWVEWTVIALIVSYIAGGLLMHRRAKAIAENFFISLSADGLVFFDGTAQRQLDYRYLRISKVKKDNDEVTEIWLRTPFRQTIKLRDLENMSELHEQLVSYLAN
jgi:hypothetical protein